MASTASVSCGPQQLLGDPVGRVEAGGVDGVDGGPELQPGGPLPGFGVDGDVLDAVVVAVVAVEGGVGRPALEEGLPVPVGHRPEGSWRVAHDAPLVPRCTRVQPPPLPRSGRGSTSRPAPGRRRRAPALARENGRLPKNPLRADSGEGWADSMITWRDVSIRAFFLRADAPHRMNTTRSGLRFDGLDDGVGEALPALPLVGGGLPGPHGQGGVEEEHALPGPAVEAAVVGPLHADVALQLGEDVLQRRRERRPRAGR